ncbi:hypothetical protein [Nonomuraea jabiensis]|uniref:hypothetical protein n=1 Tax=Nonomuraea jabiensis TaxID=882448 RepID=UPI003D736F7D
MRDNEARGPIYRKVEVRPAHHDHHDEDVVIACFTFETYGLTQHQPVPLSIEAATKLYAQLGQVLNATLVPIEMEERVTRLEERFQFVCEYNSFWDGS